MKIENMKIFLTVAKIGNINKAADELFLTHQNLSFIIKNMEKELGLKLFNRDKKGVQLTDEGRAFLHVAQPIVSSYENFLYVKRNSNKTIVFNIYTTPGLASDLSELVDFDILDNYILSFHKRNVNEMDDMLADNWQGIYILPIHNGELRIDTKQKDKIVLRHDNVVIIAHKNCKFVNNELIAEDEIPLITNSYYTEESLDRILMNYDNLSVSKKFMQTRDFCYISTRWVYENFFEKNEYVILSEKKEEVAYTLILNLPRNMKEIAMKSIVPELKKLFRKLQ